MTGRKPDVPAPGPWRNPCPICGTRQPPCPPECGFHPADEDLDLEPTGAEQRAQQRATWRKAIAKANALTRTQRPRRKPAPVKVGMHRKPAT